MTFGGWLFLVVLIGSAWGSVVVIAGAYGLNLAPDQPHTELAMRIAAPWVLLPLSLISWAKARRWRLMQAARIGVVTVSRGEIEMVLPDERPNMLERISALLVLLSLVAIPYWLQLPDRDWIVGFILLVWLFLKLTGWLMRRGA